MSGNSTTDRLATRSERESEIVSLIQQSSGPEQVDGYDRVDTTGGQPADGTPQLADAFETVMERPGEGYQEIEWTVQDDGDGSVGARPEADPYLTITMENARTIDSDQVGAGRAAVGVDRVPTSSTDGPNPSGVDANRIEGVADGAMTADGGVMEGQAFDRAVDTNRERADMDAIAERQARREAIEEAHANGEAYYDGTTTVDGVEVQIWLMPDGSTVYLDPETETVVDLTWESNDAKDAARDAAHEAGDPFFEGTTEIDGEIVEVWEMPDGSIAYVAVDDREVVGFEWPPGEEPEYQGQVSVDGESCSLIELPNGDMVIVDGDGDFVGYLDDVELDSVYHPMGDAYAVPQGPPTYDTIYYDADTGEILTGENTGQTDPAGMFTYYTPPGEDYMLIIDADGNIVAAQELPPDEEWSILGVVTYYDDGSVVVDLGAGEITVDLGAEGGIWFSSDGLGELIEGADWVGSVEAGIAWDEEGIDVDVNADVAGVGEFGYGISVGEDGFDMYVDASMDLEIAGQGVGFDVHGEMGMTSDGTVYGGVDAGMSMTMPGGIDVDLDVEAYMEIGPDGFEGTYGWDGTVGMFGAYVSGGEQYSVTVDEDGVTGTYEYYRGAGIEGVGEVRAGAEFQVQTDGTLGGSSATGGLYVSTNDKDGEETGMTGLYSTLDEDGVSTPEVRNEHLDTGVTKEDYDRHGDPDLPEDTVTGSTGVEWQNDSTAGIGEVPTGEVEVDGDAGFDTGPALRPRLERRRDSGDDTVDDADDGVASGEGPERDVTMRPDDGGVRRDSGDGRFLDDEREAASMPAPPPPSEDDGDTSTDTDTDTGGVSGRPKIWQRRDGDATDPADEPAPEPAPTPNGPRPPLFGVDPNDEPAPEPPPTDGPTVKPPIFTERFTDVDEDGDGRPDRLGSDPILGDDDDLSDITDGPPVLRSQAQTASAAPPPPETADPIEVDPVTTAATRDQSPGGIERPESEPTTADAGPDQAPGGIDRPDLDPDSVVMSGGTTMARDQLLDDQPDSVVMSGGTTMASDGQPEIEPESIIVSGGTTMARDQLLDDDITAVRGTTATPIADQPEPQAAAAVQPVEPEPVPEPVLEQPAEPVAPPAVEPIATPIVVEEPIIEPVIEVEPEPVAPVEPEPVVEPEPDLLDDQG